jgi:hypothetical protein
VRGGERIWNIDHPERADFKMVAAPYGCPGETLPRNPAPALGQDTDGLAECACRTSMSRRCVSAALSEEIHLRLSPACPSTLNSACRKT